MELDLKKTLSSKQLTYKTSLIEKLSGLFVYLILSLWFPFIGFALFYDAINGFNNNPSTLQIIFEIILFFIFMFLGFVITKALLNLNRLELVEGESPDLNRSIMSQIISETDWSIINNNKNFIKAVKSSAVSWGRQLYVLFEGDKILINSTAFGLHDLKSPFHFLANRRTVTYLKEKFRSEIGNTPHNKS